MVSEAEISQVRTENRTGRECGGSSAVVQAVSWSSDAVQALLSRGVGESWLATPSCWLDVRRQHCVVQGREAAGSGEMLASN